jgi:hypothetical protein
MIRPFYSFGWLLLRDHQGHLDQVLADKPGLEFVRTQDIADQHIVRARILEIVRLLGKFTDFLHDEVVCLKQTRNLHRHLFAVNRGTLEAGIGRNVVRQCDFL